jgi:hypothetical protein
MRGCQDCFDATFDAGDVLAIGSWDSGSLLRSTNGGETFVPVSGVHDGVAFIRARPDGGPLAIVTRHAVRTGDPGSSVLRARDGTRDAAAATRSPELAVLSAMIHGRGAAAVDIARATFAATRDLDDERAALYNDVALTSLRAAARAIFEDLMANGTYQRAVT